MIAKVIPHIALILLLNRPAAATTICDGANPESIKSKTGTFQTLDDLFSYTGNQTRLHIFGEAHFHTDTSLIRSVIQSVHKHLNGKRKCLFLELPKGALEHLDILFEIIIRQSKTDAERDKSRKSSTYYPTIVQTAKALGMPIYEIDHPEHLMDEKSEDERNAVIAANAIRLFAEKECDSAVLFIGKAHVAPLEKRDSVAKLLREKGQQVITYNIIGHEEASDPSYASWYGLTCEISEPLPAAFRNSILSSQTLLYPNLSIQRKPLWQDFDYSILKTGTK